MTPKKNEASSCDAGPGILLGGGCSTHSSSSPKSNLQAALTATSGSAVRVLKEREFGHVLGNPKVIIERRNGSAFVSIRPRPWGWANVDREFLNPDSPGVERYAQKLIERVHVEGEREQARRERLTALRQRERKVRA